MGDPLPAAHQHFGAGWSAWGRPDRVLDLAILARTNDLACPMGTALGSLASGFSFFIGVYAHWGRAGGARYCHYL